VIRLLSLVLGLVLIFGSVWGSFWLGHYLHSGPEGYSDRVWQDIPLALSGIAGVVLGVVGCGAALDPTSPLPPFKKKD
jgi:hypothetical protein